MLPNLGMLVGMAVGSAVSLAVGLTIGLTFGLTSGFAVGLTVGSDFGLAVGVAAGLGFVIGPILGGMISGKHGARAAYAIGGAVAALQVSPTRGSFFLFVSLFSCLFVPHILLILQEENDPIMIPKTLLKSAL